MSDWVKKITEKLMPANTSRVLVVDADGLFSYTILQKAFIDAGYAIHSCKTALDVRRVFELELRGVGNKAILVVDFPYAPHPDMRGEVLATSIGYRDLFPYFDAAALKGLSYNALCTLNELKPLVLAIIAGAYPIFSDILGILAKVYRVQELASRAYATQKIGDLYGSNRTLAVALDAVFPMLVDLGIITREKVGVYRAVSGIEIADERVAELFVASVIRLSGGKHISLDDFEYRDWHFFFKPKMPPYIGQSILTVTASGARQGYVEFRKEK